MSRFFLISIITVGAYSSCKTAEQNLNNSDVKTGASTNSSTLNSYAPTYQLHRNSRECSGFILPVPAATPIGKIKVNVVDEQSMFVSTVELGNSNSEVVRVNSNASVTTDTNATNFVAGKINLSISNPQAPGDYLSNATISGLDLPEGQVGNLLCKTMFRLPADSDIRPVAYCTMTAKEGPNSVRSFDVRTTIFANADGHGVADPYASAVNVEYEYSQDKSKPTRVLIDGEMVKGSFSLTGVGSQLLLQGEGEFNDFVGGGDPLTRSKVRATGTMTCVSYEFLPVQARALAVSVGGRASTPDAASVKTFADAIQSLSNSKAINSVIDTGKVPEHGGQSWCISTSGADSGDRILAAYQKLLNLTYDSSRSAVTVSPRETCSK